VSPKQQLDLERLENLRKHPRLPELRGMVTRNANEAKDARVASELRHGERAEAWTLLQLLLETAHD
jgi:hypothetical protein